MDKATLCKEITEDEVPPAIDVILLNACSLWRDLVAVFAALHAADPSVGPAWMQLVPHRKNVENEKKFTAPVFSCVFSQQRHLICTNKGKHGDHVELAGANCLLCRDKAGTSEQQHCIAVSAKQEYKAMCEAITRAHSYNRRHKDPSPKCTCVPPVLPEHAVRSLPF